ncbi:MAG: ATP-binding cassette domain-containing protein, partial [Planctomycetes bacterium]|nr:ATP-binding cassette domain-containing protein [Planctomycetota bacterium]
YSLGRRWTFMGKVMEPLLTMQGITKVFGNTRALDDVGIALRPGEVQALMGENGAGKSTLMKILIGLYHADAGTVRLGGQQVAFTSPREALTHGIAMIHQELYPVRDMSVADNIFLGRESAPSPLVP